MKEHTSAPCTNGDKIRALMAAPDSKLAKVLLYLNDMGELDDKIHFCRELPACQVLVDRDEGIDPRMCLLCLTDWLGRPADEKLWRDLDGSV